MILPASQEDIAVDSDGRPGLVPETVMKIKYTIQ